MTSAQPLLARTVVIAGASGFVGTELIPRLLSTFSDIRIVALSRKAKNSNDPRVVWHSCDLFSEESIDNALPPNIDCAYYLVHSMGPTAQLDQGNFADYDLILADNFAKALSRRKVRQLVYLGGLAPEGDELSLHLQSRMEMEAVFTDYGLPSTFLRAGLILGGSGSSFQMLVKLVKRLHVMICPAWTQTLTTPVDLQTVVLALVGVIKEERHIGRTYDLAGCRPLTYVQMMKQTAESFGLRRFFISVPFFSPTLSRLWVSLVTNTSKNLVYPLIESLQHPMIARQEFELNSEWRETDYRDLLKRVSVDLPSDAYRFRLPVPRKTVRSVQRLPIRPDQNVKTVSDLYFSWLPRVTAGIIRVQRHGQQIQLRLCHRFVLIQLQEIHQVNDTKRVVYAIQSGLLVRERPFARLEFREVLSQKFLMVAIHDYEPALPWFVYKLTQAQIHLWVMVQFSRFLNTQASRVH